MIIKLSNRLKAVAEMIPICNCFADIGTDHAYLPIYCVSNNITQKAIAGDIAKGPCLQGRRQVERFKLQQKIEVRCGKGMTILTPYEVDGISIAGLGGGTIIEIMSNAPQVLESLDFLVLQPQSNCKSVRFFLRDNGWQIIKEALMEDNGIIYQIMLAKKGLMTIESEFEASYGKFNIEAKTEEYYKVLRQDLKYSLSIKNKLAESSNSEVENKKLRVKKWIEILLEEINNR